MYLKWIRRGVIATVNTDVTWKMFFYMLWKLVCSCNVIWLGFICHMPFVCERLIMSGMLCPSRGKQSTMTKLLSHKPLQRTSVNSATTVLIISYTIYGNAKLFTRSALALFVILLQMSVLHCLVNFLFCVSNLRVVPEAEWGREIKSSRLIYNWQSDM